jgi:hypothetical protein
VGWQVQFQTTQHMGWPIMAILGFCPLPFLHEKVKSCNLYLGFADFTGNLIPGAKG